MLFGVLHADMIDLSYDNLGEFFQSELGFQVSIATKSIVNLSYHNQRLVCDRTESVP